MFPISFPFYSTLSLHKSDCHHSTSKWNQSYQGQQWWGVTICSCLPWESQFAHGLGKLLITSLSLSKKLVHWTTNYMGNKSSNQWPPCLKLHRFLLRSFSTCLKCFLMTSKCWHVARFQLTSSAPLCSLLLSPPISFWCPSALVSPREHNISSLPIHWHGSLHPLSRIP